MIRRIQGLFAVFMAMTLPASLSGQTYQGSGNCQPCHSALYTRWQGTLHAKIHLLPNPVSVRPEADFVTGKSISMGASFNNAQVVISKSGPDYFAQIGASGTTYRIAWTYGWGFKQRYLVKIDTSYYMLPVQYNLNRYLDNSTGAWVTYNPGNWFNADGSPKATNTNSFRTKSWDRNCVGCHVTGGRSDMVVVGADTSWRATWANGSDSTNILIGCESCHGPKTGVAGPGHQMNPSKLNTKQQRIEVCGQCHNRASSVKAGGGVGTHEFPKDEVTNTYFNPADTSKPLSQFLNTSLPPNGPGGQGTWPDLVTARQHHQQYQEMLGSKHYTNSFVDMDCMTCHTAHGSTPNDHNLRDSLNVEIAVSTFRKFKVDNDDNTLCLACHAGFGPFAAIPKDWVANEPAKRDSIGMVVNAHTRHALYDPLDLLKSGGIGRCSKCHMTKTATTAVAYDIHTHTFAVVPPIRTRQFQSTITAGTQRGSINSCAASCHRNGSTAVVGSIIPDWSITDPTKTDWSEATDVQLADTLWRYWQAWGFSGVKPLASAVPGSFELSQNYPNPFNPSTKIMVSLASRDRVRLVVYNILGQVVATLMDGVFDGGRFEVSWSGLDDSGLHVTSGVYLYRLDVGGFSSTKKMLMLK